MGVMVYSFLWVMQNIYHPPQYTTEASITQPLGNYSGSNKPGPLVEVPKIPFTLHDKSKEPLCVESPYGPADSLIWGHHTIPSDSRL